MTAMHMPVHPLCSNILALSRAFWYLLKTHMKGVRTGLQRRCSSALAHVSGGGRRHKLDNTCWHMVMIFEMFVFYLDQYNTIAKLWRLARVTRLRHNDVALNNVIRTTENVLQSLMCHLYKRCKRLSLVAQNQLQLGKNIDRYRIDRIKLSNIRGRNERL